jgi:nitroreductase
MNGNKKLKIKMYKLLDKHGKLRKEPYAKHIDDELFKDILELCKWYEKQKNTI